MSSITDLSRPSTWLLLTVLAANVTLPLVHFWPAEAPSVNPPPALEPRIVKPAQRSDPVVAPANTERVALRKPVPVCRAWGPFTELADAEALAGSMALDAKDFEVFQSQVEVGPDYLVTVRAVGGGDVADRVMRELESQGVDSYVLERGSPATVLAAGVFSTRERAAAQQRRLVELGYEAVVAPLERSDQVYHLLARMPADQEPEVAPLGACGDIAPLQQFL